MSGARLESAGQVRSEYPLIAHKSIAVTLPLVTAGSAIVTPSLLNVTDTDELPFDSGPDKNGRLFVVIMGASMVFSGATLTPADTINGELTWIDGIGRRYSLFSFGLSVARTSYINSDRVVVPYTPLFGGKLDYIGRIEFANVSSALTTSASVNAIVRLNIGYYGDYSEFDLSKLAKCEHHHYHYGDKDSVVDMTAV